MPAADIATDAAELAWPAFGGAILLRGLVIMRAIASEGEFVAACHQPANKMFGASAVSRSPKAASKRRASSPSSDAITSSFLTM